MISCITSQPIKVDEIHSAMELKKRKIFDGPIERGWDTSINPPTSSVDSDKEYEEYEDKDGPACVVPDIEDTVDVNGKLLN